MPIERKLAAIMFTDIAGYTALSAKDENKALALLDKQEQILTPIIEEFNGTLHNKVGDGLLFTFPTVTDAVKCGIKIQQETKEVEDLNLRIGIHEGEITLKDGDALGDDVNVASRIDPFAAEGGIVISGKVQQNISSLPEFKTKFISEPLLKGVRQEVKIFCIISHGLPETDITKVTVKLEKDVKKLWHNQKFIFGTIGLLVLSVLLFEGYENDWWLIKRSNSEKIKNYFIHFTSDEKYIEDYNWFNEDYNWFNEDVHGVTSISDSLLNTIKKSVFSKVTSQFQFISDIQFELSRSQDDYDIINQLIRPRKLLKDIWNQKLTTLDSLKIENESKEIYLNIQNRVKNKFGFIPEVLMSIYVFKVNPINNNKPDRIFYEFITYWGHMPVNTTSPKPFNTTDELIDDLSESLERVIIQRSLGGIVGSLSEVLEDNLLKIKLYDKYLKRDMKLESRSIHVWGEDGHEKWMEDLLLTMQWMENDTASMDSDRYNHYLEEYTNINNGSKRYYHHSNFGDFLYHVELINVTDSTGIAKVIWKSFPLLKMRPGDRFTILK